MSETVFDTSRPLPLPLALAICKHYELLVDGYYDLANPGLGKVDALLIYTYGGRNGAIEAYKQGKLAHGGVFKAAWHRNEDYDIMLVARLHHPQLKDPFEIFKDFRTYIVEQSIDFPFDEEI